VKKWALARPMIMLQMLRIWSIPDGPLCSLLDGEEAKWAVAFAGGCFSFAKFRADTAGRLTSSITDEEDFLESGNSLLRATDYDSISNGGAVRQDTLVNGF
jgi:hypothetical protein